jgi:hypothetical protein
MSEQSITTPHDDYAPETGRESSIHPDDISLDRDSFLSPDKSVGLQKLREFGQIFEEKQKNIKRLFADFDSIIEETKRCFLSKIRCTSLEVEGIWTDYSTLRNKRDMLISKINADAGRANSEMVKDLISRYDEKENAFYKIICQKIADEYHDGGGMKNCTFLHERPVSYLYKKLVEGGRSLSKFFNPLSGYYSAINRCLNIIEPPRSVKSHMSIFGSQMRNTLTGKAVKPIEYGGKKLTKNKLRKNGRKVTKRRKTIKRRKTSKK